MWPNSADLVSFTEEILNKNLIFCAVLNKFSNDFYIFYQISYLFTFIRWHNFLVEFYGNGRPVEEYFLRHRAKNSRFLICVILRQTHILQVPPTRNITSHTLKGLRRCANLTLKAAGIDTKFYTFILLSILHHARFVY